MEDLTKNWNNLALSEKENTGFVLPKVHKSREFIIAANIQRKFFKGPRKLIVLTFKEKFKP